MKREICDSKHLAPLLHSSAQKVPLSIGGYESGRDPLLRSQVKTSHRVLIYKDNIVHDKCPHDQRFWETDEWECGWIEMTQMLLLYISAHLYVVFLENERALDYLYLQLRVCVSGGWSSFWYVCVYFIPHCVSTVFPYVSVSLMSGWKAAGCSVRVCLCASVWMLVVQSTPHSCQILSLVFSLMFWWQ